MPRSPDDDTDLGDEVIEGDPPTYTTDFGAPFGGPTDAELAKWARERAEKLFKFLPAFFGGDLSKMTAEFQQEFIEQSERVGWFNSISRASSRGEWPTTPMGFDDAGRRLIALDKIGTAEHPGSIVQYARAAQRLYELQQEGHTPVMVFAAIAFGTLGMIGANTPPNGIHWLSVPSSFCERHCDACFRQVLEMQDDPTAVMGGGSLGEYADGIVVADLQKRVQVLEGGASKRKRR